MDLEEKLEKAYWNWSDRKKVDSDRIAFKYVVRKLLNEKTELYKAHTTMGEIKSTLECGKLLGFEIIAKEHYPEYKDRLDRFTNEINDKPEDIIEVKINMERKKCGHCGKSYHPIPNPKWNLCRACFDLPIERKKDGSFGFVDKPECATTQIGGIEVEFPLPDIKNDIPMPEVKDPLKIKVKPTPPYIEANGVKYYPESEEPKCEHELNRLGRDGLGDFFSIENKFCPDCGEKL